MSSIPRDLLSQVSLGQPRSPIKSAVDAEPFSFVLHPQPAHATPSAAKQPPQDVAPRQANAPSHTADTSNPSSSAEGASGEERGQDAAQPVAENTPVDHQPAEHEPRDIQPPTAEDCDNQTPSDESAEEIDPEDVALAAVASATELPADLEPQPTESAKRETLEQPPGLVSRKPKPRARLDPKEVEKHQNSDQHSKDSVAADLEPRGELAEVVRQELKRGGTPRQLKPGSPVRETDAANSKRTRKASAEPNSKSGEAKRVDPADGLQKQRPTAAPSQKTGGRDLAERTASRGARRTGASGVSAPNPSTPIAVRTEVTESQAISDALAQSAESADTTLRLDRNSSPNHNSTLPIHSSASSAAGSRLHDHLITRSTRKTNETTRLSHADQNRFLHRVARAFDAAKNREGGIRIRLSPPELGSLRLEVRMQQGAMIARLEAETSTTRTLLMENLQALRDRLADQGVRIEQFEIDLLDRRDQNSDRRDQNSFAQQGHTSDDSQSPRSSDTEHQQTTSETPPSTHHEPQAVESPHSLNVII